MVINFFLLYESLINVLLYCSINKVNVKRFSSLSRIDYFLSILVKNNILLTLDDEFVIVVVVVVVVGLLTTSPGFNTPSDALLLVVAVAVRLSSLF